MNSSGIGGGNSGSTWDIEKLNAQLEKAIKEVGGDREKSLTKIFMYIDKEGQLQFEKKKSLIGRFLQVRKLKQTGGFLIQSADKGLYAKLNEIKNQLTLTNDQKSSELLSKINLILEHIQAKRNLKNNKVESVALKVLGNTKKLFEEIFEKTNPPSLPKDSSATDENSALTPSKIQRSPSNTKLDTRTTTVVTDVLQNASTPVETQVQVENQPATPSPSTKPSSSTKHSPLISTEDNNNPPVEENQTTEEQKKDVETSPRAEVKTATTPIKTTEENESHTILSSLFAPAISTEENKSQSITPQEAEEKLREVFNDSQENIEVLTERCNKIAEKMEKFVLDIQQKKADEAKKSGKVQEAVTPEEMSVEPEEIIDVIFSESETGKTKQEKINELFSMSDVLGSGVTVNPKASEALLRRIATMLLNDMSKKNEKIKELKQYKIQVDKDNELETTKLNTAKEEAKKSLTAINENIQASPLKSRSADIGKLFEKSIDEANSSDALDKVNSSLDAFNKALERLTEFEKSVQNLELQIPTESSPYRALYENASKDLQKIREKLTSDISSLQVDTIESCIKGVQASDHDLLNVESLITKAKAQEKIIVEKEKPLQELRSFIDGIQARRSSELSSVYLTSRKNKYEEEYAKASNDLNKDAIAIAELHKHWEKEINEALKVIEPAESALLEFQNTSYKSEIEKQLQQDINAFKNSLGKGVIASSPFKNTSALLEKVTEHHKNLESLNTKNQTYLNQMAFATTFGDKEKIQSAKQMFEEILSENTTYSETSFEQVSLALADIDHACECAKLLHVLADMIKKLDDMIKELDKTKVKTGVYKKNFSTLIDQLTKRQNLEETKKEINTEISNIKIELAKLLGDKEKAKEYKNEISAFQTTTYEASDGISNSEIRQIAKEHIQEVIDTKIPDLESSGDQDIISFYEKTFPSVKEMINKKIQYANTASEEIAKFENLQLSTKKAEEVRTRYFTEVSNVLSEDTNIVKFKSSKAYQILTAGNIEIARDLLSDKIEKLQVTGKLGVEFKKAVKEVAQQSKNSESLEEMGRLLPSVANAVDSYSEKIEKAKTDLVSLRNISNLPKSLQDRINQQIKTLDNEVSSCLKGIQGDSLEAFAAKLSTFDEILNTAAFMKDNYPVIADLHSQDVREFAALFLMKGIPFSKTLLKNQEDLEQFFEVLTNEGELKFEYSGLDDWSGKDLVDSAKRDFTSKIVEPFNKLKTLYTNIKSSVESKASLDTVELLQFEERISTFSVQDEWDTFLTNFKSEYQEACLNGIERAQDQLGEYQTADIFGDLDGVDGVFETISNLDLSDINKAQEDLGSLGDTLPAQYSSWENGINQLQMSWKSSFNLLGTETNPFAKPGTMAYSLVEEAQEKFQTLCDYIGSYPLADSKDDVIILNKIAEFVKSIAYDLREIKDAYTKMSRVNQIATGVATWTIQPFVDIKSENRKIWKDIVSLQYCKLVSMYEERYKIDEGVVEDLIADINELFKGEITPDIHQKVIESITGVFGEEFLNEAINDSEGSQTFGKLLESIKDEFPYQKQK